MWNKFLTFLGLNNKKSFTSVCNKQHPDNSEALCDRLANHTGQHWSDDYCIAWKQ